MSTLTKRQANPQLDGLWWRTRERLRAEMDPRRFVYWILPMRLLSADYERVVIACHTPFSREQSVLKFGKRIADIMAEELPGLLAVDFIVEPDPQAPAQKRPTQILPPAIAPIASAGGPPGGGGDDGGEQRRVKIEQVKRAVAEKYRVSVELMESPSRKRDIVQARQIGFFMARNLTGRSYPEIARRFGDRDHTTAIYGYQKILRRCESDAEFAAEIKALQRKLTD